jgi:hypothetical protein
MQQLPNPRKSRFCFDNRAWFLRDECANNERNPDEQVDPLPMPREN